MKIIEALKSIKDLQRKADDIKAKIEKHCADLDCETPIYADQKRQVSEWLQSHGDIIKEILSLRYRIQKTNVLTEVQIELGGIFVKKTIAEWIHRRRDLAKLQEAAWRGLTDRGLKDGQSFQLTPQSPISIVKRRLYFDPAERDSKIELYRMEPAKIDGTLEVINATVDLL